MTTTDEQYWLCDVCGKEAGWHADGVRLCWPCVKAMGADLSREQRRAAGYYGPRVEPLTGGDQS